MTSLPFARMSELNDETEREMDMITIAHVAKAVTKAQRDFTVDLAIRLGFPPFNARDLFVAHAAIAAIEELRRKHGDGEIKKTAPPPKE